MDGETLRLGDRIPVYLSLSLTALVNWGGERAGRKRRRERMLFKRHRLLIIMVMSSIIALYFILKRLCYVVYRSRIARIPCSFHFCVPLYYLPSFQPSVPVLAVVLLCASETYSCLCVPALRAPQPVPIALSPQTRVPYTWPPAPCLRFILALRFPCAFSPLRLSLSFSVLGPCVQEDTVVLSV